MLVGGGALNDKDAQSAQGWDIVISNPPYISAPNQLKDSTLSTQRESIKECGAYKTLHKKWDLYIPFVELGISHLCKNKAICAMIIPYPFTNQPYAQKSREMIMKEYSLSELVDLQDMKVFKAEVLNCIVFIVRKVRKNLIPISKMNENRTIKAIYQKSIDEFVQDSKNSVWNTNCQQQHSSRHSHLNVLGDFCYISVGMGLHSSEHNTKYKFQKKDLISQTQDEIHCKAYIEGKDIDKYSIKNIKYLEYNTERCPNQCREPRFKELFEVDKIITGRVGYIKAMIDCANLVCNHTLNCIVLWHSISDVNNKSIASYVKKSKVERKTMEQLSSKVNLHYLLGILNSHYANILLDEIRGKATDLYPNYLKQLPIPKITKFNKPLCDKIITLVDRILESKAKDSHCDTSHLESEIDDLVYQLYCLSDDEIKNHQWKK